MADQVGLSLEETTGGLAAFASAGLLGSDAGTSFKTMLQRLVPQSEAAATKMAELGISAYDAQGNFIGMEDTAAFQAIPGIPHEGKPVDRFEPRDDCLLQLDQKPPDCRKIHASFSRRTRRARAGSCAAFALGYGSRRRAPTSDA